MRAVKLSHRMYGLSEYDARRYARPMKRRKTRAEYEAEAKERVELYKKRGWMWWRDI